MSRETDKIVERYTRRQSDKFRNRYSLARPFVREVVQERRTGIEQIFSRHGIDDLSEIKLLEVGCGAGRNLVEFIDMGFRAENLCGIELLADRVEKAREVLPKEMVQHGDACAIDFAAESQDIVYQSVVFSSLLDDQYQSELAARMWSWVKPGGAVLWYDFVYDNPFNPDVRGVGLRRIRRLFPEGHVEYKRITLAPPLGRVVTSVNRRLYRVFNTIPLLRTHLLCWIQKS